LFIVGQDRETVEEYVKTVGVDPGGVLLNASLKAPEGLTDKAADALIERHPNSALLIGLNVVDSLEAINSGALDKAIDQLLDRLAALQRPIFLRFGYEFDGTWNHYDPDQFRAAWIKFYQRIKAKQIDNIALVWQSAASCDGTYSAHPLEAWYPGGEFVDWVGLSYLAPANCDFVPANAVLNLARQHRKPVMIAAATPQGYDIGQLTYSTDGTDIRHLTSGNLWKGWFQPFFDFVRKNTDVIRAVTYLNADWDSLRPDANGYRGNARVQANPGILEKWKAEIADARYLQAAPDLFAKLGYTPVQP